MLFNLLTLAGLIIAVVVFLNFLSAKDGVKHSGAKDNHSPDRLNARKVLREPPSKERPRICPVCGTLLGKQDYLLAALEPEPGNGKRRRAQIYGCPYCYATDGVNLSHKDLTALDNETGEIVQTNKDRVAAGAKQSP